MRTGPAQGRTGHFHEAGLYSSDAEFRALIVPFVEAGIAAGEPVILGYDDRKMALLHSWLPDPSPVMFLGDKGLYATPARAIAAYQRLLEQHVAAGAEQIRITGEVPHPGNGGSFQGWDRYECAVNVVWERFPVWGFCLYDTTTAPPVVLDAVERTHRTLVSPSGARRASARYQDVGVFEAIAAEPDPLEEHPPTAEFTPGLPADARRALARIGRDRVTEDTLQDLLIALSETVGNAFEHGRPPVTVRIWAAPDRLVASVHDCGPGVTDRLAGLVPAPGGIDSRGLGLWVTHQLDIDVALIRSGDGFTVRLRGGARPG